MDPKSGPNHELYVEVPRRMTSEQHLNEAFELSEMAKSLFIQGLREQDPNLSEGEFHRRVQERLELGHNRNW